jgi:hypothetical protein
MKTIQIQSSVGVGKTDTGAITLGNFSKGQSAAHPHRIQWGESSSYLVGENMAAYAKPLERLDFQRLSGGPELRALTYTSLGLLLGSGEFTISIMTGLPIEALEDKALAQKTKNGLRKWLEGTHHFRVNDQETILHIQTVAALPQPAGTFFAWGLNDAGKWVRSQDDFHAPVAICDVGFNTLDLLSIEKGKPIPRFTGGDTAGMRRAVELLLSSLEEQYQVHLSLQQGDALIRQGNPTLQIAAGKIDLRELVGEAKQAAAGGIVTFLDHYWENGRQFRHVIFTGGGTAALHDSLIAQYPLGYVMPDPVMANALGLARYGRRVFDTEIVIGLDPGFGGFKAVQL